MAIEDINNDISNVPVPSENGTILAEVDRDELEDRGQASAPQVAAQPDEQSPLAPPPISREMSQPTACDTVKTGVTKGLEITAGAVLTGGASMLCCPTASVLTHAIMGGLGAFGCPLFFKPAVVGCVEACEDRTPSALRFSPN